MHDTYFAHYDIFGPDLITFVTYNFIYVFYQSSNAINRRKFPSAVHLLYLHQFS